MEVRYSVIIPNALNIDNVRNNLQSYLLAYCSPHHKHHPLIWSKLFLRSGTAWIGTQYAATRHFHRRQRCWSWSRHFPDQAQLEADLRCKQCPKNRGWSTEIISFYLDKVESSSVGCDFIVGYSHLFSSLAASDPPIQQTWQSRFWLSWVVDCATYFDLSVGRDFSFYKLSKILSCMQMLVIRTLFRLHYIVKN